ncbi:hypothetical protein [Tateyamaria sp.]
MIEIKLHWSLCILLGLLMLVATIDTAAELYQRHQSGELFEGNSQ